MKIVFLIARYYPFFGGAEKYTAELATRAVQAGHDVTVLTTDASPDGRSLSREEINDGVKIIRLHRWNQQLNLGFYPRLLPALLGIKADVVHVTNGPGFIWHDFCLLAKKLISPNTKFITTPHGPFLVTPGTHSGLKYWVARIGKIVMTPYFWIFWRGLFHKVIRVTPRQQEWMVRDYKVSQQQLGLVPNGISASLILAQKPQYIDDSVTITFVGRIEKYKGVQNVITALDKFKKSYPNINFKFKVMGKPGPVFPQIQTQIQELSLMQEVELIITPSDEVRDQILANESQIFVLPSQWEGTGIVLLEAMAKGNAVISTYQNEGSELIIEEGVNGFVYDYNDQARLVEILTKLILDKDLRHQMIALNLARVNNFTWESIYPRYEELLRNL